MSIDAPAAPAVRNDGAADGRRRGLLRRARPYLLGSASVVILLALWQLAVAYELVKTAFLPAPVDVAKTLATLFTGGAIWSNLAISGQEFFVGMVISVAAGAVLGILTGWYKPVDEFLKPIVIAVNGVPHVALVPILILVYGIGVTSKVVVVILSCVTVVLMNTATGVANVEEHLNRMSKSFCATDLQTIRTVVVPSIVPYFMSGLRISIGRAVVGVVVGEIFASRGGIGNMLIMASNSFNMPEMYATLLVLTAIGIVLTQGAGWLERRLQRWRG
ncbi:MAG TPA: ABC transporter permease [Streptosporangiaceae bacterium]|jgi:NitT/TauT family transport system permease protein